MIGWLRVSYDVMTSYTLGKQIEPRSIPALGAQQLLDMEQECLYRTHTSVTRMCTSAQARR
jgi:hypothetical protein